MLPVFVSVRFCSGLVLTGLFCTTGVANVNEVAQGLEPLTHTVAVAIPVAVPRKVTRFWELAFPELVEMTRSASLSPVVRNTELGVKVTAALQLAPGVNTVLNPLPQGLVAAGTTVKWVPEMLIPTFRLALPLLVIVTVCGALELGGLAWMTEPKVKLVFETTDTGAAVAVPLSLAVCLLPAILPELSVTVRVAVSALSPCGAKAAVMLQEARGARVPPIGQLLACWKLVMPVPSEMLVRLSPANFPVLLSVTVW